jgi:hypothetical protein
MGDTGLEPVTSCVSSMHSMFKTAIITSRTPVFWPENGDSQSAVVALHRRNGDPTPKLTLD